MYLPDQFRHPVGASGSSPIALTHEVFNQILSAARVTWPDVAISPESFFDFLVEKLAQDEDAAELLRTLHTSDLYLACACLLGDPPALAAIERDYLSQLGSNSQSLGPNSGFTEELKQALRERVLVARPGEPARIASYNGRGPLAGWLRIVAARLAIDLRRKNKGEVPTADPGTLAVPVVDLELQYLKERYRSEFEEAIQGAFRELPARDRTLIRLHSVDGVPLASIATMYQVSARTVQRWIAAAHTEIKAGVRRTLAAKFALTETELDSLLGLVISQLSVTLHDL